MRSIVLVAFALPTLLSNWAQDCGPDEPTPTPTPNPEFAELSASLEAERVALGAPGLAFSWFQNGEVRYAEGFGTRYPDRGDPVLASSLFRIASVNKMLTATGLLQQVDRGLVDLDTPISQYIPDLEFALDASWDDTIHVRHLLDHSAGFYDYLEINGNPSDDALETFISGWFAENIWVMSPPGRMWNYANPNFYVAGLVAQEVSGRYYRGLMSEDVFTPIGMSRTVFLGDEVLEDGDYAAGLTPSWASYELSGPVVEPDSYDNGWARPCGFAWSSVLDLAKFGSFLTYGDARVLTEGSFEALKSEQINTEIFEDLLHYGFGLMIYRGFFIGENFYDSTLLYHNGALPGYASEIYVVPDLGYGFVSLASTDGAYLTDSAVVAFELGGLPPPSEAPDLAPKPETFVDCVGHYDDPWNTVGPMDVTLVDGNLEVSLSSLDRLHIPYEPLLEPYTPDNFIFVLEGYGQLMTFLRDDSGGVEYARTRLFVSTRAADAGAVMIKPGRSPATKDVSPVLRERARVASAADGRIVQFGPPTGWRAWHSRGARNGP